MHRAKIEGRGIQFGLDGMLAVGRTKFDPSASKLPVPPEPPTTTGPELVRSTGITVLLLDDDPVNLHLRGAILRQHGYASLTAMTVEEAAKLLDRIDIAVLDYHLGAGQFGTAVASKLRRRRPEVPIIILSAILENKFGGADDLESDIKLLKGHSSVDDLLGALRSFEARRRGAPVVVDARDFFYSRISLAIGPDVLVQILDGHGNWFHCNEAAANYLGQPREWFPGRNLFAEIPSLDLDWIEIVRSVAETRETYIDRTRRSLFFLNNPSGGPTFTWSVLAFPITLHDRSRGLVLTARILDRNPTLFA